MDMWFWKSFKKLPKLMMKMLAFNISDRSCEQLADKKRILEYSGNSEYSEYSDFSFSPQKDYLLIYQSWLAAVAFVASFKTSFT